MDAGERPSIGSLWDWKDLPASEARFRERVARSRAAGDEADALEAETQVARTFSLRDRFAEAHALLDALEPRLPSAPPVVRVRHLLERGRTFRSSGDAARANPLFREAFDRAGAAGLVALSLDAAHMVALVEGPEEALRWAHRAIGVAEGASDPGARGWLGPLYNNTGWTHHERGEHERALDLWTKGLAPHEAAGRREETRIARRTIATGLRALRRHDEALAILRRIHAEDAAANEGDGYWREEMAETLLALGRREEARPHFARAADLLAQDSWLAEHEAPRLERLRREGGG